LAYGQVKLSGSSVISASGTDGVNSFSFGPGGTLFDVSKTKVGLAFGCGVEGTSGWLSRNLTWKLEYLYVDLGSLDGVSPFSVAAAPSPFPVLTPLAGANILHTRVTDNIVRVGLNYKLGN
jgi:outer membrane immunogenic protein